MSAGKCPNCGSSDYGQNIVTFEGNRCNRCGYCGPVVEFHRDEPRPISAGRVAELTRADLDRPSPRRARAMPAVAGFHTPPRNKLWYLKDD